MRTKITADQYKSMCKAREIADLRGCKPETAYTIGFYDGWAASVLEENSRLREVLMRVKNETEYTPLLSDGTIIMVRNVLE